jgi:hypothetical protein
LVSSLALNQAENKAKISLKSISLGDVMEEIINWALLIIIAYLIGVRIADSINDWRNKK